MPVGSRECLAEPALIHHAGWHKGAKIMAHRYLTRRQRINSALQTLFRKRNKSRCCRLSLLIEVAHPMGQQGWSIVQMRTWGGVCAVRVAVLHAAPLPWQAGRSSRFRSLQKVKHAGYLQLSSFSPPKWAFLQLPMSELVASQVRGT